jgi:hypothetical protein
VTVRSVNGRAIETWAQLRWEVLRQALDREVLQLEVINPQREIGLYRIDSLIASNWKSWRRIRCVRWGWCSTVRAFPRWSAVY